MLVKCPQCNALLEAIAGRAATCKECGFSADVPAHQETVKSDDQATLPPPPVQPAELLAPFSFLAGLAAVATFYLAWAGVPFVLALAAIGMGVLARKRLGADNRPARFATGLGVAGIVFGAAFLWLG